MNYLDILTVLYLYTLGIIAGLLVTLGIIYIMANNDIRKEILNDIKR